MHFYLHQTYGTDTNHGHTTNLKGKKIFFQSLKEKTYLKLYNFFKT